MTDQLITPESLWPLDGEYAGAYAGTVRAGAEAAKETDVAIVAICRNALPALANTLPLMALAGSMFRSSRGYIFENDSEDQTAEVLDKFAELCPWPVAIEHATLGGIDSRGFERERTERLARCRNKCLEWVRANASDTSWTVVLDTDPAGGFSPEGILNSVGHLSEMAASPLRPGGMASYSLYRTAEGVAHYDAWAARPVSWWRDRREEIGFTWFSAFMPPVGSTPCPMNSAFGGLAVYRTEAFLAGGYVGDDCEHVGHHKKMHEAGWQMYLNPGCRYIAVWNE